MMRVLTAVDWWNKCSKIKNPPQLIVSGQSNYGEKRPLENESILMANLAIARGIPERFVVREPLATCTREHPIRIKSLSGINSRTRIGVVTSSWHMRRALAEFQKHFDQVIPYPTEAEHSPWSVLDIFPQAGQLSHSTELIHEWIGKLWYAIRS
jgi:uncharacterized SAM-binding protein YcdF (DUF218 family)